ncbi:hypothetical protein PG993_013369 [Apiospora rasikravindrae]|uniref:Uncharacterized protein n=1 Tax=Apiospora rasikravindrae TaxID=990691 RepID=A0ABR1RXF6_9PEZI
MTLLKRNKQSRCQAEYTVGSMDTTSEEHLEAFHIQSSHLDTLVPASAQARQQQLDFYLCWMIQEPLTEASVCHPSRFSREDGMMYLTSHLYTQVFRREYTAETFHLGLITQKYQMPTESVLISVTTTNSSSRDVTLSGGTDYRGITSHI